MKLLRKAVEVGYQLRRDGIFERTKENVKLAHDEFVRLARWVDSRGLSKILLNCRENRKDLGFEISNAAGFDKNGNIPPVFLKYLGFDRIVIGTVTYDKYDGNSGNTIKRYPETESLVNWMKLPGPGAKPVADNMNEFGEHGVPVTVNLMSTPEKQGDELLRDLEGTVLETRDLHKVSRFELNISCPNTHSSTGGDSRNEYQSGMLDMVKVVRGAMHIGQELDIKVSPDLGWQDVQDIVRICAEYNKKSAINLPGGGNLEGIRAFTTTNTTAIYDPRFITSPPNPEGRGGASGEALYKRASDVQSMFEDFIRMGNYKLYINACGGINSAERAKERTKGEDVVGIQIFTPLIFKGPRLLRELRSVK
ncbi:hypothetical protein AUJ84_04080 [Candidatus Pacearchaeota archaeon CG1_02_32_132]|nr:MAG: hypothetical protein AUJ84_04080 [Candidatus Pacearchaeota archaeon CG1_02_32_132]